MGSIHIVKASAGSGKTFQLTYEYIARVIETPGLYRNILAVTFTNKATEEMKQRIVSKLNELAQGCPNEYVPMLEKRLHYTPELIRQRAAEARTKILPTTATLIYSPSINSFNALSGHFSKSWISMRISLSNFRPILC